MPFVIKILNAGISSQSPTITNLYTVPSSPTLGAIVSNVRLVNTHATVAVTANVYYKKSGGTAYLMLDKDKVIPANDHVIIKPEITMGPGDILEAVTAWGGGGAGVDFAVFGMEKI